MEEQFEREKGFPFQKDLGIGLGGESRILISFQSRFDLTFRWRGGRSVDEIVCAGNVMLAHIFPALSHFFKN